MKNIIQSYRIDFLDSLKNLRGYSDLTVKSYDETLREASRHVEILHEGDQTIVNLMPYRIVLSSLNPKTITKKLSAIHTFTEYLSGRGMKIILKADEGVKVAKTLPKPISEQYILKALKEADMLERVVVTILYTCGLRVSELSSLKLDDISEGWLRVLGKGSKHRDVPLIGYTKELIDKYREVYTPKRYLFEKKGKRLSENSLRYIVNKVFRRVALKVTPHQLRHSYASSLLNGGAPIVDVSELLGHSSMATTQIYTKLGTLLKQQNYDKAHPLCGENR